MHVVILSDFETQYGGAAIGASLLATGLSKSGSQVTRIVSYPDGDKHDWKTRCLAPSLSAWGALRWLPGTIAQPYAARNQSNNLRRLLAEIRPTVINIHNLHGALSNGWTLDLLEICQEQAPVVWTLHDMWSFTGRCAHSLDCDRYLRGCDHTCPTADEYPVLAADQIAGAWNKRADILADPSRMVAVSPSFWLADRARAGLWSGHRVEVIPNGIQMETNLQPDRQVARQALDIQYPGMVVLMAGSKLDQRNKGGELVGAAFEKLPMRPITLLTMGATPPEIKLEGVYTHHLGFVDNERVKSLAYAAADVYLHPSLADNLPFTIIESIACGTPVVAFAVGGVVELVRPSETGWLVELISPEALANGLQQALKQISSGVDLSSVCRKIAEQEYSLELQVQRYQSLFESLI